MLNKEKYVKEIAEAVVNSGGQGIGVKDWKPFPCRDMNCNSCNLNDLGCDKGFSYWANSEYVEPTVDWSKVAVDTPILVKNTETDEWKKRYFATYGGGEVCA